MRKSQLKTLSGQVDLWEIYLLDDNASFLSSFCHMTLSTSAKLSISRTSEDVVVHLYISTSTFAQQWPLVTVFRGLYSDNRHYHHVKALSGFLFLWDSLFHQSSCFVHSCVQGAMFSDALMRICNSNQNQADWSINPHLSHCVATVQTAKSLWERWQ